LNVSDRIRLTIDASDAVVAALRANEQLIRSETLALDVGYGASGDEVVGKVGDGIEVRVTITPLAEYSR
jgi:isoleucyl-tRNA synthetase